MAKKTKEVEIPKVNAGELGVLLRQYRESIGYSAEQVADAMCLSTSKIKLLENEAFENLAEPPYIRGYLRSYAKLADKDPAQIITLYESLRGASPSELDHHFKPAPGAINRQSSLFPTLAKLAVLILFLGALITLSMLPGVKTWFADTWNSFSQQTNDRTHNNNPLLTGNMPAPLPIPSNQGTSEVRSALDSALANKVDINIEADISNKNSVQTFENTKKSDDKSTIDDINSKLADVEKANEKKTKDSQADKADDTNESSSSTVKIKLVFNKEVWLRIRNSNKKTVYEGQSPAGQEKELELERPLTFRIGNAQGISIFVDGKAKDISKYIKGSVASFTLQ